MVEVNLNCSDYLSFDLIIKPSNFVSFQPRQKIISNFVLFLKYLNCWCRNQWGSKLPWEMAATLPSKLNIITALKEEKMPLMSSTDENNCVYITASVNFNPWRFDKLGNCVMNPLIIMPYIFKQWWYFRSIWMLNVPWKLYL